MTANHYWVHIPDSYRFSASLPTARLWATTSFCLSLLICEIKINIIVTSQWDCISIHTHTHTHTYYVYTFCLTSHCYRVCINHLEVIWYNFTHNANNVGYFISPQKILLKRILIYRGILNTKIIINNNNIAYSWYSDSTYYGPIPTNTLCINWFTVHKSTMR